MRYFLILILSCALFQKIDAQIVFKIEELSLFNYNVTLDSNIIDGDLENGPDVYVHCIIVNNTDTSIVLEPSESTTKIGFRYNKSNYELEVYLFALADNKKLNIYSKDTMDLDFGTSLLLGTDIFSCTKHDYTKEVLAILPTLKVWYRDKNINIYTNEIKNVIIK